MAMFHGLRLLRFKDWKWFLNTVISFLWIISAMVILVAFVFLFFGKNKKSLIPKCFILEDLASAFWFSRYFLLYFVQDCRSRKYPVLMQQFLPNLNNLFLKNNIALWYRCRVNLHLNTRQTHKIRDVIKCNCGYVYRAWDLRVIFLLFNF